MIVDHNEIVDNSEKLGSLSCDEASFFLFQNMISDCGLREVPCSGNKFSWAGERNKMYIQCHLDRALENTEWFQLLPRVHGEYLEKIGSDHGTIFVRFLNENMLRTGQFMFDKRLVS